MLRSAIEQYEKALAIEPDNCRQNYVEACFKFIGPVKTLLDQGVKVVGEFEMGRPDPETYYDILDVYVNREIELGAGTEATAPANGPTMGALIWALVR